MVERPNVPGKDGVTCLCVGGGEVFISFSCCSCPSCEHSGECQCFTSAVIVVDAVVSV